MITGLYAAQADLVPILCITDRYPWRACTGGFSSSILPKWLPRPVTKWATTVLEPGRVPRALSANFSALCVPGRPGPVLIDLPVDVQAAKSSLIILTPYEDFAAFRPTASRAQIERALEMLSAGVL